MNGVTITIPKQTDKPPFSVGDRIAMSKRSRGVLGQRIKNKETVYRMLKKKFQPLFKITSCQADRPYQFSATLKPLNF